MTETDESIECLRSEAEFNEVLRLHFLPGEKVAGARKRFYKDKLSLFLEYDPDSILVKKIGGEVAAFLIYTCDEAGFSTFSGPRHLRFYRKLLLASVGYYGFDLAKYFRLFKAMALIRPPALPSSELSPEKHGKIWALVVSPDFRRRGIASQLISASICEFRKKGGKTMRITVKKDNDAAIAAYCKCGFKVVGECMESTGDSHLMEILLD